MKKISLELQWAIGEKTGIGWYIYNIVKELNLLILWVDII